MSAPLPMPNLGTYLDAPRRPVAALGATEAPAVDPAAWQALLAAERRGIVESWNAAANAYRTLRKVRQTLGAPFVVTGEAALDPRGALTAADDQRFMDQLAVVDAATKFLDDALDGRRKVGYDAAGRTLTIESLPTDGMRVELRGGVPRLVDMNGALVDVDGTIQGLPVLIWVAIAAVAITLTICDAVKETSDDQRALAERKTMETISEHQDALVKGGHATPEQASAMKRALIDATAGLKRAEGALEGEKGDSGITGAVKAITTAGIVIAAIYLLAQIIPMFGARRAVAGA